MAELSRDMYESPAHGLSTATLLQLLTDSEEDPCIRTDCRDELARRLEIGEIIDSWRPMVGEAIAVPIPTTDAWEAGL